jgi:hypothetical protein
VLYAKGVATPQPAKLGGLHLQRADSLDGASDLDQGISPVNDMSNIVPADANGLAFSRTTGQVLNIVFLTAQTVKAGLLPQRSERRLNSAAALRR